MAAHLNIVVVEDNGDLRDAVLEVLVSMGHRVMGLSCAEELGDEGAQAAIDLLVVDLNLPGEDGMSLSRRLRQTQPGLSIIMITARNAVRDKIAGYEAGADIYLAKPVSIEELGAAVRSVERRLSTSLTPPPGQQLLSIEVAALTAQGPVARVELTAVEVALLSALARAPGRRLEYWQLLEVMLPGIPGASQTNLAVRMTRLRKKLQSAGFDGNTLQVVRQQKCYQLCLPVQLL